MANRTDRATWSDYAAGLLIIVFLAAALFLRP